MRVLLSRGVYGSAGGEVKRRVRAHRRRSPGSPRKSQEQESIILPARSVSLWDNTHSGSIMTFSGMSSLSDWLRVSSE